MDNTAYSIAASIFRYVFLLIMAFIIISVSLRSATSYHTLIKKKRRLMEMQSAKRCIVILEPDAHRGERFYIDGAILIGRAEDDDICFTDARLKKHHALIFQKDESVYIDSKRKKNVYLNDLQNTSKNILLHDGDEVAIEELCFAYYEDGDRHE